MNGDKVRERRDTSEWWEDWWPPVNGDKVRDRRDASADGLTNHIKAYLAEKERLKSD